MRDFKIHVSYVQIPEWRILILQGILDLRPASRAYGSLAKKDGVRLESLTYRTAGGMPASRGLAEKRAKLCCLG